MQWVRQLRRRWLPRPLECEEEQQPSPWRGKTRRDKTRGFRPTCQLVRTSIDKTNTVTSNRATTHYTITQLRLCRGDEPGRAELCGAVEGLLGAVPGDVPLVLPTEHLPDVAEGLVDGGPVAGARLPHEELPPGACRIQVLELHGHVVERLLRQRLVVVVRPERAEVAEPLARRQRGTPDLLLEKVVFVQHQHERRVAEAWLSEGRSFHSSSTTGAYSRVAAGKNASSQSLFLKALTALQQNPQSCIARARKNRWYLENSQLNLCDFPAIHVNLSIAVASIRLKLAIKLEVSADDPVWLLTFLYHSSRKTEHTVRTQNKKLMRVQCIRMFIYVHQPATTYTEAASHLSYLPPESRLLVIPIPPRLEIAGRPVAAEQLSHLLVVEREPIDDELLRP
ncbi:hypothetical protein U9M48_030099 [Paspalum notatum var. saurae]|uniref:Uncharacterized protein n=1 Tax=Paspalum notatum var. saurae TaxID=547442 RepID=A0AAQ3U4P0_PASNO